MKILFDLTAIYDHLTGIERYAINITKNLILSHPKDEYILIFKKEIHTEFEKIAIQQNVDVKILEPCNKFIFNQWRLYRCVKNIDADRFIFLSFTSPWLFRNKNIINTIHDISAWDCPFTQKRYMVWYGKIGIKNAIKVSRKIVTVSQFSKSRLIERLHADSGKLHVVYNGVSDQFINNIDLPDFNLLQAKYDLPSKYILCLSTLEPRKNMKLLIDAFLSLAKNNQIDCDLVLAGRKGWKLDDAIGEELNKRIHVTGFIEDADLPALYKNSTLFVFPSRYEGFGIPVIEAMSQGALVVSSDSSSLPEIIGEAGLLFKNNDVESLKHTIMYALNLSEKEKESYIRKGYEQIKKFDWKTEADRLYEIL